MSNLYSGLRQQAMSPMYGMSQPQSGFIPGGSYDPYQGMGGYGGGFGGGFPGMGSGYSMFGSYNAMPDYTGGYMPGYGSQLPSQFGGGASQFGGMSQFGGGFGGGFGGYGMQPMQPNVNDLFGQYMFGQYYGAPSFNPFQATSMFGAGGGRGFGGGQRRGSREQLGGIADQLAQLFGQQQAPQQPASPFEGLELDIDALRAALGLSGQSPASPTAQITPNEDLSRGAAQLPPVTLPQTPFDLNAFNQLSMGNLPAAPLPPPAAPQPPPPMVPPAAPTPPPVQIPPNLNLFVPGFTGLDQGAGGQVQQQPPIQTAPTPPPAAPQPPRMTIPTPVAPTSQFAAPQASLPETGGDGRFYTLPPSFGMSIPGTPVPPEVPTGGGRIYVEPPVETIFAQSMPTNQMPALPPSTGFQPLPGVSDRLAAAQEAALKLRRGGRG
jgi:hypothetical protein